MHRASAGKIVNLFLKERLFYIIFFLPFNHVPPQQKQRDSGGGVGSSGCE